MRVTPLVYGKLRMNLFELLGLLFLPGLNSPIGISGSALLCHQQQTTRPYESRYRQTRFLRCHIPGVGRKRFSIIYKGISFSLPAKQSGTFILLVAPLANIFSDSTTLFYFIFSGLTNIPVFALYGRQL